MYLHFIRHTTPYIKKGICYGQLDIPAHPDKFETEAHFVKLKILNEQYDKVYSSPLKRCSQLAEYLFEQEIIFKNELKEVDFGDWENKPWSSLNTSYAKRWMDSYVTTKALNGESYFDLFTRVSGLLEEIIDEGCDEHIAIVTHAGVIRSSLCYLDKTSLKDSFSNYPLNYGDVVKREI